MLLFRDEFRLLSAEEVVSESMEGERDLSASMRNKYKEFASQQEGFLHFLNRMEDNLKKQQKQLEDEKRAVEEQKRINDATLKDIAKK